MKRLKFKKFAGVRAKGVVSVIKPETDRHVDRAVWLTAMVESNGKFGTAMNYDGTGMTASIGQAVAVYPKALADDIKANDQGSLWKILARIAPLQSDLGIDYHKIRMFFELIDSVGWFVSEDGKCRHIETGRLVAGGAIRKEFTGSSDGVMPLKGKHRTIAQKWVNEFSTLFSCPDTFPIQLAIEREHIIKRTLRTKLRFSKYNGYRNLTLQHKIYNPDHISIVTSEQLEPEMDLAMSMFWSNSVNAPSFALKRFCKQIIDKNLQIELGPRPLAKKIINVLGNTPFARWDDDIKGGRYQRTRRYAMKLWPKELFEGADPIMPKDLKG